MKINNKGFTLVEILAVIIILGILAVIMVPSVTSLIEKNKEDNMENLKKSIISAAKIYMSDNRYNITLDPNSSCVNETDTRDIDVVNGVTITDNKLLVSTLVDSGDLNEGNNIINNSKDDSQKLDLSNSYVVIKYKCDSRDYEFSNVTLNWVSKINEK